MMNQTRLAEKILARFQLDYIYYKTKQDKFAQFVYYQLGKKRYKINLEDIDALDSILELIDAPVIAGIIKEV